MHRHKLLFFDIETAPMSGYMWHPKTEYVPHNQRIADSYILTWAAKWQGERTMQFDYLSPHEIGERDDTTVVSSLAELVREADVVVAHNGRRFDLPRLNSRLLLNQLPPLTPTRMLDTIELTRKSFDLPYHRLDYLAQVLLGEGKIETDFELWRRVAEYREPKAMKEMVRYNKKDVDLMERVYDRIFPYVRGLPRLVTADYANEFACPYCGSYDLVKRGRHDTNAGEWQTWECKGCGRYPRERTSSKKKLALVPTL